MVDLPTIQPTGVTSEAPKSSISPSQVAAPYQQMAEALDKVGQGFDKVAVPLAEQAGYKAVTRDAEGNVQVAQLPLAGPAADAYSRAVKFAALAEGEGVAKRADIAMRQEFHDNPEGYLQASAAFKDKIQKQYTDAAGPEVGITMGRVVDNVSTQTYRGLLNEKEWLDLQRAEKSIDAGINSARDDLVALARGGDTSSPAFQEAYNKVATLTNEKVANPRLAYPKEAAAYDMQHMDGVLRANGFLYHVDQVYKDQGVNPDGSSKGGAANALEEAKRILTDPSVKLTEAQRQAYHNKAVTEIRANEAIRKQDVQEADAAAQALTMTSAVGGKVVPEDVEMVASAYRAAGAPGKAAKLYATWARKPLNDDFGRQPIGEQTSQLNALRGGAALATSHAEANLIRHESGGDPTKVNQLGYAGTYQFGAPLLKDLGIYTPGAGENLATWSKTGRGEPGKWSGTFNVPGFPQVKTLSDFLANPAAQKAAFDAHVKGMDDAIAVNGMDRYIGMNVGGVPITREGLHAMIHLGGAKGAMQVLGSNGAINPRDANGTSLLDYARVGANGAMANPANSMWLDANRSTTLQKANRDAWSTVMSEYDKSGIRPADATINQITNAARATNDAALLDGIGAGTERMDIAQGQSRRSLPEQAAALTALKTAGGAGELSAGQSGVLKDLQRRNDAITKGLAENPISTTVQNFPERFGTPAPLDLKNPDNLVAGLQQRGRIAQFAQQNWQTKAPSALDEADLHQVQAALDTPSPAIKGAIFGAISTLPEEIRNATLAKIGEKRPDFMVSAAAGSMMKQAPEVAQSIFRGQEAIKADKGYLPTEKDAAKSMGEDMDKLLPAAAFSLAGRTTDNGPYEVARGMIKARYADLSAQSADTTGKLNSPRLKTAVDDVTGGVLNMNGGPFLAPQRGMPQWNFDRMMLGVTENDLAGVTTLNGQPVTPDYLRGSAQLESVGNGQYLVRLGKDPLRPAYAYQNANTETPQKFVLDLRNRPAPKTNNGEVDYLGGLYQPISTLRQWQEQSFGKGSSPLDYLRDGVIPPKAMERSKGSTPSRKNGDAIDYHPDAMTPDVRQIPHSKMGDA